MSLLTPHEAAQAVADVRCMILAAGRQGTLWRTVAGEGLFGHEDEAFAPMGEIALELRRTPPERLPGGIDAVAAVLPEADARAQDRLQIEDETYRVQTVVEERLFGAVTHKSLQLVNVHGHEANR